jgi:signal transduction histidine kinase
MRWSLTLEVGSLMLGALLLALGAAAALRAASSEYGSAAAGYRELTRAFEVGAHVRSARTLLGAGQGAAATRELEAAARRVSALQGDFGPGADDGLWRQLEADLGRASGSPGDAPVDASLRDLSRLASGIEARIGAIEAASAGHRRRVIVSLLAGAVVLAAGAVAVGVHQYRTIALPLERVRRAAAGLSAGLSSQLPAREVASRVPLAGPSELRALAADFNRMAEELEALYRSLEAKVDSRTRQLLASSRMASVGYLAAGVAHEINNPLAIITGFAERALRSPHIDPGAAETLRVICEEAFRCKDITGKLLALSRPDAHELGDAPQPSAVDPVPLADLCRELVRQVAELPVAEGRTVSVVEETAGVAPRGRSGELRQVALNLLINALEATPTGGSVTLTVSRVGDSAVLSVADTGSGIAAEDLPRIFEPFFTRRRDGARPGLGLGLPLAQTIVESHGGSISAASGGAGAGATVTVTLPLGAVG